MLDFIAAVPIAAVAMIFGYQTVVTSQDLTDWLVGGSFTAAAIFAGIALVIQ